ncbi:L,D-transpeptidase family protein [Thiorhodococcus minor]|uniref:L,D-transpeptidase family protein n=1 Tax=Thiorhodococcus minor TaxID=57489 RepID=A0A6M0JXW9_9GAMM|nr:L,D-transpeptidase family protein [Thiorhodococcus minor]NEV60955.1 L,D-transpeptidase family protein [Thiorhodococcus minor]
MTQRITRKRITRKPALLRLAALSAAPLYLTSRDLASEIVKEIQDLQPGEFTWHPERSPKGGVAVVVWIPEQLVHVYRNGIRSSTYNNAPMPNMNRLTWDGIALHAGKLPGYPASHGCVRLPLAFSKKLWTVTHLGTPVIVAGSHSDPWELTHLGMVLGAYAEEELEQAVAGLEGKRHPSDWEAAEEYPVTTVVASTADRKIDLLQTGWSLRVARIAAEAGAMAPPIPAETITKGRAVEPQSGQGRKGSQRTEESVWLARQVSAALQSSPCPASRPLGLCGSIRQF